MSDDFIKRMHERLAEMRRRDRTIFPRRNWVDTLVDALEKDNHTTWGLIIYRTSYSNNQAWSQFLQKLNEETREEFEEHNGLDVLEQKANTIMDDAAQFDGMSSLDIREHCKKWVADNYAREQGRPPADSIFPYGGAPRYRYAVQIDEEVLTTMTRLDFAGDAWVKLIDLEWFEDRWDRDCWSEDEDEFVEHEQERPIEGMTQEDVGWLRMWWLNIAGSRYVDLSDRNFWAVHYRRPPAIYT